MSKGKVLITGASRGIGRAVAELFGKKGYELILVCHKDVRDLQGLPGMHFAGDIGDHSFVERVGLEAGPADILINNAGIACYALLQDTDPDLFEKVIRTNLTSVYNTCRVFVPGMIKNHRGKIINISSRWGDVGAAMETAYSASKGGVNAFTKALAHELAPSGIQVNAISLGVIDTDMNSAFNEEEREALVDSIPSGRMGTPEDVAEMVLSIAESNDYLTGQVIPFDGGWI